MSLFGSPTGSGSSRSGGTSGSSKNLIELRAGKMTLQGRMVHPDKRKGLLYIQQADDGLMHLCWKDRSKSNAEDDLIIFPDDVEYKHVPQCTTGRVYVLKFKTGNRKLFFWLQEPKTDKDEENCKKINEFLNNPPVPGSNRGGASSGGGAGLSGLPADLANLGDNPDLHNILSGMSQQQLMQLISGMGGSGLSSLISGGGAGSITSGRSSSASVTSADSAPASRVQSSTGGRTGGSAASADVQRSAAAPAGQSSSVIAQETGRSAIQVRDLANILSSIEGLPAGATGGEPKEVDLAEGLNGELLIPLLAKPEIRERLAPFLAQGESLPNSEEELRQTIHSPQFQQAVRGFSAAFSSGQLGPLIAQFDLGDAAVAAANAGDMCAFAKALQETADKKKAAASGGASAGGEAEKPMDVDEDKSTK